MPSLQTNVGARRLFGWEQSLIDELDVYVSIRHPDNGLLASIAYSLCLSISRYQGRRREKAKACEDIKQALEFLDNMSRKYGEGFLRALDKGLVGAASHYIWLDVKRFGEKYCKLESSLVRDVKPSETESLAREVFRVR